MSRTQYSISETLQELRDGYQRSLLQAQPTAADVEILCFRVGGVLTGCEMSSLARVISLRKIVPLPAVKGPVLGIVNYEGAIIAVIDLCALLNVPENNSSAPEWILVAKGKEFLSGLQIENILGIDMVPMNSLHELPSLREEGAPHVVKEGLMTIYGPLRLLDIPALLALPVVMQ